MTYFKELTRIQVNEKIRASSSRQIDKQLETSISEDMLHLLDNRICFPVTDAIVRRVNNHIYFHILTQCGFPMTE